MERLRENFKWQLSIATVVFSQPFHSVNGLLIKGSYFSFSFILPKNEAVTIFWLHNSTIQFGLEQLYGFCDKKKLRKI